MICDKILKRVCIAAEECLCQTSTPALSSCSCRVTSIFVLAGSEAILEVLLVLASEKAPLEPPILHRERFLVLA